MPLTDDVLSELAQLLRVRPELDDVCRFGGPWISTHVAGPAGWAYFHLVTRGHVQLDRPGFDRLNLVAGDILLLPNGDAHTVHGLGFAEHLHSPVVTQLRGALRIRTSVGVELDTELICGRLHFQAAPQTLVMAALPSVVILHIDELPLASRFKPLVEGIREELSDGRPGAASIAINLASALFMMMIRAQIEKSTAVTGLLQLFNQKVTSQAVLAMIREPVRAWTLDDLAHDAGASRATLVRAFRKAAGIAPLAFLADLRLGLARHRLGSSTVSVDRIAAEVGYQSPAAFSRAFLRKFGVRPSQNRKA
ncbi:helix-turn-helix transcriptional regulator [Lichenicola cladoniae]|uniref:Helix-turn-helix transcriptional regulator n=2 Tax=Lichenicola cladoniae TaxID=1484109 RepID=A0A6M8HVN1_9PROT|nr:helix-turn-helix transcriptional regulator [Acetobacteraceae bacterium]QKE92418.1 helix-turn-helix transcriptional regulator [Lichenicola cladoniae]